MRGDPTTSTDYLLRVATDEIEYMENHNLLNCFPHIAKAIRHPLGQFVARHVQNFCWTVERVWKRPGSRIGAARPAPAWGPRPKRATSDIGRQAPIWIDVTNTARLGYGGGIDRVAMQLALAGVDTGLALPVVIEGKGVRPLFPEDGHLGLTFEPGITYVLVDAFWNQIDEYVSICATARERGASVVVCSHDIFPLDYPSLSRKAFNAKFIDSYKRILAVADACIAVSGYTATRIGSLIDAMKSGDDKDMPIASFRLGADGHVGERGGPVRQRLRDMFHEDHVFLGVGTLEPRKGYAIVLDAFDRLWADGMSCSFVILGRYGWMSKALEHRILTHPLLGEALHWVDDASDAELAFAYRNAYCLVQASVFEGFGLPIVEANREGTPVIATDNAIFRELAGDDITYFRSCDSADLRAVLERAIRERPSANRLKLHSWTESLAQMVARIREMTPQKAMTPQQEVPRQAMPPQSEQALRRDVPADAKALTEPSRFGLRRKMAYVTRSAPLGR